MVVWNSGIQSHFFYLSFFLTSFGNRMDSDEESFEYSNSVHG